MTTSQLAALIVALLQYLHLLSHPVNAQALCQVGAHRVTISGLHYCLSNLISWPARR